MFRKIALLVSIVAVFSMALLVSADPSTDGCYVELRNYDGSLALNITAIDTYNVSSIYEGQQFQAVVKCENVTDQIFAVEFNTSTTGTAASAVGSVYTHGDWNDGQDIIAENTLAAGYAATHLDPDFSTDDFTLGSFTMNTVANLTDDSDVTVDFLEGDFRLLDDQVNDLADEYLRTINDAKITVLDIDLATLTGNVIVASEGVNIDNLDHITVDIDNVDMNVLGSVDIEALGVTDGSETFEIGSRRYSDLDDDNEIEFTVSVAMESHLACTRTFTLNDAATTAGADLIGTLTPYPGDVTNDGDPIIDLDDADLVAEYYGLPVPVGNPEYDIDHNGAMELDDLIHIGRNYGQDDTTCISSLD